MRIALHNFTGGEVSPILAARYDLSRYGSSVQCMENMLPGLHGDVRRRPGTLFLGSLEDEAVLLPFSFNALAEQNFVLVLSGNGLSIADIHGFDPQEGSIPRLSTPYEARHLLEICAAQVGDTVYLAHTAYPLHKLVRSTDSEPEAPLPENAIRSHGYRWTLEAVALNSSLPAPQAPGCTFVRGNNDDDAGLGYTLRYKIVAVDANGKQSLASEAGSCDGKHPSDWVVGNRTDISWTAVEGATEYNIYREEAGYYGFIGVSSGTTFSDNNYQADTADTPREDWDPFADGNNPSVVAFHQQRMVLAGTRDSPQAFYLSRSGDFENFRKSRPLQDDDPVEYLIASGSIDAIAWAASFGAPRAANTRPAATAVPSPRATSPSRPSPTGAARALRPSSSAMPSCMCSATAPMCATCSIRWKKTAMRAMTFPSWRRICSKGTACANGPTSRRRDPCSGSCATTACCWP